MFNIRDLFKNDIFKGHQVFIEKCRNLKSFKERQDNPRTQRKEVRALKLAL